MDIQKTGGFIAQKRKNQNLTQKQLADKIGVTDKAVSRWETGKGMPEVSLLQPLAEALGVSLCELLNGEIIAENERASAADNIVADALKESDKKDKKLKNLFIAVCFAALAVFALFVVYITSVFKSKTQITGDLSYSVCGMLLNILCAVLTGAFVSFLCLNSKAIKLNNAVLIFTAVLSCYLMLSWLLAFTPLAMYIPKFLRPNSALPVLLGSVVFGAMLFNRIRELIKRK